MLIELHVRGLGPLADCSVAFSEGLNVLTGETGAGKTLLVTSLSLLGGARADAHMGDASMEAALRPTPALRGVLAARGFETDGEVVLARRTGTRSRAWVSGSLVPAAVLAEIGELAFEVHGQGESFALARPQAQMDALDQFAGALEIRALYENQLASLRVLEEERDSILAEERERARTIDVLSFQVEEIGRARVEAGEDDAVAAQLARLENAERLGSLAAGALSLLGPDGAAGALDEARKELSAAAALDASLGPLADRAASIAAEGAELASDLRAWSETLDSDPATLEALRERAGLLAGLKRKYGDTLADVLGFAAQAGDRLAAMERAEGRLDEIQTDVTSTLRSLEETARRLTSKRRRGAANLSKLVASELPELALPAAVFEIVVESLRRDGEHGRDRVEFRFSAERSRPPGPLGRIASGGELSRVMIAVTLALAGTQRVPTLVFDEADQGVGGQAALELARRLSRLGRTHQVLVVTHLPQIAAFADRHLLVEKARVRAVEGAERVAEISRMLAGLGDSKRARAHAEELVAMAGAERNNTKPRGRGRVVAEVR